MFCTPPVPYPVTSSAAQGPLRVVSGEAAQRGESINGHVGAGKSELREVAQLYLRGSLQAVKDGSVRNLYFDIVRAVPVIFGYHAKDECIQLSSIGGCVGECMTLR